ncbi:MAG: FkbM family methyltransferase, partial [Candidatus Methanospirareceae archaeon]
MIKREESLEFLRKLWFRHPVEHHSPSDTLVSIVTVPRIEAKQIKGLTFWTLENEYWIPESAIEGAKVYKGDFGVVVDIGAHVGGVALYAAKNGAKIVYAIEPTPINYFLLTRNILENRLEHIVTPLPYAIGEVRKGSS